MRSRNKEVVMRVLRVLFWCILSFTLLFTIRMFAEKEWFDAWIILVPIASLVVMVVFIIGMFLVWLVNFDSELWVRENEERLRRKNYGYEDKKVTDRESTETYVPQLPVGSWVNGRQYSGGIHWSHTVSGTGSSGIRRP